MLTLVTDFWSGQGLGVKVKSWRAEDFQGLKI